MLTIKESEELMLQYVRLKKKYNETKNNADKKIFQAHQTKCIDKFSYLVFMHTARYRQFSNYDDLNQDGMEALVRALNSYKPHKSIFFYWAHKYIATKIARTANQHTTIRYPLKVAKEFPPYKESEMPLMIEEKFIPDKNLEATETTHIIQQTIKYLNDEQKNIVSLIYGLNSPPVSINKVCKKMKISRVNCLKILDNAMAIMRGNIKL